MLTVLYSLYSESRGREILNLRLTCAYIMRHSEKVRRNGRKGVKRKRTDFSLDVYVGQLSVRTSVLPSLVQKVTGFTDGAAEYV